MNDPVIVARTREGRVLARVVVYGPPHGREAVKGVVEVALRSAGWMDAEVRPLLRVVTASAEEQEAGT